MNVTDSAGPKPLDPQIATLQQPILIENPDFPSLITVSDFGRLIVQTDQEWALGRHRLKLIVSTVATSHEDDDDDDERRSPKSRSVNFDLLIVPCINVLDNVEIEYEPFTYIIGEPLLELPIVESLSANCTNSKFSIEPLESELPQAFSVNNDADLRQVIISIQASSLEEL